MELKGKHVAILGIGASGVAAARLALRHGAHVSAWDQAELKAFSKLPNEVICHPQINKDDAETFTCDYLIISPGIDTYGELAQAFAAKSSCMIGEVEFASRFYSGKIIGITGTNGKTTTTEIVAKILAEAGLGGVPCGNYGTPFSEVVMMPLTPPVVALELSSFQLETIDTLKPDVAIWLNFAPDHMDRYPSIAAYRNAKERIAENQTALDLLVLRDGEQLAHSKAKIIYFSTENQNCEWYSNGRLIYHHGKPILDLENNSSLRGRHNAENLMAAIIACLQLGVSMEQVMDALKHYHSPPHRCELIRTLDDVEYLNDSKATNLHAMESAIRSQHRPIVLIAGGKDKGLVYDSLLPLLSEKVLQVITFGQIAQPLAQLCSIALPSIAVNTLNEAICLARTHAPRGSCVLLSPGTSSFDQFSGYEERGNVFRDLVHQMY